jgi:hypothetical protein
MNDTTRTSGCICGAVELSITGTSVLMGYCHCESCRRWIGAPIHASALWRATDVEITKGANRLATFKRTEATGSHRRFCKDCGGPVLIDHPTVSMIDIPATLIRGFVFEPEFHSHYSEKVLAMPDGLPKFRDFHPSVGGTDEMLPE